jgi:NAD(P)-dependent dehydrogenase (short-subunit alcohol dehydrogenase family)
MRTPDVSSLERRRVLVTGAASGIGLACATRAAAEGAVLLLTDVNEVGLTSAVTGLQASGATVAYSAALDITDVDAVQQFAKRVHERGGSVDVIMNVAGISAWGTVQSLEHRQWRSMVEVNLMGPIHVIEAFVPAMIEAGRGGWLVNVSSAAGLIGLPWHAAYSASKFGIRGVSEVLRFDLRRYGIGVSLVCPGGVATPLAETVEVAGIDKTSPQFRRVHDRFVKRAVSPQQAAAAIARGIGAKRYLIYTSRDIQLLFLLQRLAPPVYGLVMRALNAAMYRVAAKSGPA